MPSGLSVKEASLAIAAGWIKFVAINVGTARVDTHLTTWVQADADDFEYTRRKTGVPVFVQKALSLRAALGTLSRKHVCILTTEWGKPFTVDGFSGWMRDAMTEAGLPLDCRPHGVRKTFGRLLADAGASAHDIMAALGSVEIHLEWMTAVAR